MTVDAESTAQNGAAISSKVIGDANARIDEEGMGCPTGNGNVAVDGMPIKARESCTAARVGLHRICRIPDHNALVFVRRVPLAFVLKADAVVNGQPGPNFPSILSVEIVLVVDHIVDEIRARLAKAHGVAEQHIRINVVGGLEGPLVKLPLADCPSAAAGAFRLHVGVTRPEVPKLQRVRALGPSEVVAEVRRITVFAGGFAVPRWSRTEGRSVKSSRGGGTVAAAAAAWATAPTHDVWNLRNRLCIGTLNVVAVGCRVRRTGVLQSDRVDEIGVAKSGFVNQRRAKSICHTKTVVPRELGSGSLRGVWNRIWRPPPQADIVDIGFRLAGEGGKGAHLRSDVEVAANVHLVAVNWSLVEKLRIIALVGNRIDGLQPARAAKQFHED